jgi:RNA polymerase sigma-70 factor (ECF subfamily)
MNSLPAQRTRADRALERLYRRHAGDVYRYALAVLHDEKDAEAVTQTTFSNARHALARGDRLESPHTWLISVAHDVCRQRCRQALRRLDPEASGESPAEDERAPMREQLLRALAKLRASEQAALVMRELEGRRYAEIASLLELPAADVESLIFGARRALREHLEQGLACADAELAISRELDGRLSQEEKAALRRHLRACPDCTTFARRQRVQRLALRSLAEVPLPPSLAALFAGDDDPGDAPLPAR